MNRIGFALLLVFCSATLQAQWIKTNGPPATTVDAVTQDRRGQYLFAGTAQSMFLSSNSGDSWVHKNSGLDSSLIFKLLWFDDTLFVGTDQRGAYKSTNNGDSWTRAGVGIPSDDMVYDFSRDGDVLFAATSSGVYRSTDAGYNWSGTTPPYPQYNYMLSVLAVNGTLFAGSQYGGVHYSTDSGASWISKNNGLPDFVIMGDTTYISITSLNLIDSNLFACTVQGIYKSTDFGENWSLSNAGMPIVYTRPFVSKPGVIFVGLNEGVYFSVNNGALWSPFNDGLPPNTYVFSLAISGDTLYAGTQFDGVWLCDIGSITSVPWYPELAVPQVASLGQNFPNPFNPSTQIPINVVARAVVRIDLYDMLGRNLGTILNEEKSPGSYYVSFDASPLSSGVYVYRLQAERSSASRMMTVLK